MKISEIKPGSTGTTEVVVLDITEGKVSKGRMKGSAFLTVSISDGETKTSVKIFDTDKELFGYKVGDVIFIELTAQEYNESITYLGKKETIARSSAPLENFVISAPVAPKALFDALIGMARKECGVYQPLVEKLLMDNKEKLLVWGAAKAMHHAIRGGLLYHTYSVARIAYMRGHEANNYPSILGGVVVADVPLLVSGAILHDIGKLRELNTIETGDSEYTPEGSLLGHLYIGCEMIVVANLSLPAEKRVPEDKMLLLKHLILAHHGKLEYGSPVLPQTIEAEILHEADESDAKLYEFCDAMKPLKDGELGDKAFALGTRTFRAPGAFPEKAKPATE